MLVIKIGNHQFNAFAFEGMTQKQAIAHFANFPAEVVKQAWKQAQPIIKKA
jgi:hypothetical protein